MDVKKIIFHWLYTTVQFKSFEYVDYCINGVNRPTPAV